MEKKEKGFLYQMAIEVIVIFIGITLALLIDSYKERQQSISEVKNHFSLISNEFSKDLIKLKEIKKSAYKKMQTADSLCYYLENGNHILFNNHFKKFEFIQIEKYYPRIDEINLVLNSSSFTSIYNKEIFSDLNNLKTDSRIFMMFQENEVQLINELKNEFIYENLNYKTKTIKISSIKNKNYILNKLEEYVNILSAKSITASSLMEGYSICIEDVKKTIN
ncbi:hypothetical protein [Fluviicola taffensis]|uniref:hypothetical protein n=1 Tax=Fluviicola taffensis TaxID=191579 RepID=UPI0031376E5D